MPSRLASYAPRLLGGLGCALPALLILAPRLPLPRSGVTFDRYQFTVDGGSPA